MPLFSPCPQAYVARNTTVGYWQGMAYVAAFVQLVFDSTTAEGMQSHDGGFDEDGEEATVFWAVCLVLETVFSSFYELHGVRTATSALESILLELLPTLYGHFMGAGFPIATFTTRWLICGFTSSLPCETAMRIWDALLIVAAGHLLAHADQPLRTLGPTIAGSGVDVLLLVSVALFRIHEQPFLAATDAMQLRETVHILMETQYDHDIVIQAAYHEVLSMAARLAFESDSDDESDRAPDDGVDHDAPGDGTPSVDVASSPDMLVVGSSLPGNPSGAADGIETDDASNVAAATSTEAVATKLTAAVGTTALCAAGHELNWNDPTLIWGPKFAWSKFAADKKESHRTLLHTPVRRS